MQSYVPRTAWLLARIMFLGERGLRIPEDVSVAGFGGYDESTLLKPDLTTLRFDSYGLGYLGG